MINYMSILAFGAVALITYWWWNAGAFSSMIHMLCVITAGAVSFAVWEPLSYAMIDTPMGGHAKGLALVGTFIVTLTILRLATDRLVLLNLTLPRAADVVVGGAFGLVSGTLSVGIMVLSMGYFQSSITIGDFTGWSRRQDVAEAPTIGSDNAPLLFISNATAGFYGYLSWGSFTPWLGGGTFATHSPDLAKQSASLNRDSHSDGEGRISMSASAVSDLTLLDVPAVPLSGAVGSQPQPAVGFTVSQEAYDGGGQQFLLTASQARIIGAGRSSAVAHPVAWMQATKESPTSYYFFNSSSAVVTSVPSEGEGKFVLVFPKSAMNGQVPKYVELKGSRMALPAPTDGSAVAAGGAGAGAGSSASKRVEDPDATDIDALCDFPDPYFALGNTIVSANDKGALVLDKNNLIISGEQKFPAAGSFNVSSDLRVRGFQYATGQRILRIDASATEGGVRIFPDLNEWVRTAGTEATDARVAVVDEKGAKYYAVGLVQDDGEWMFVKSMGGRPLRLRDIPIQPLGGGKKLRLYFRVPALAAIKALVLVSPSGERVVNTMNLAVPKET
jgi:hypothetical protein